MTSRSRHRKRLLITLQLKNAEVYPGSNLHGTAFLQLLKKPGLHSLYSHSFESSPKQNQSKNIKINDENDDIITDEEKHQNSYSSDSHSIPATNYKSKALSMIIIETVSISVSGICILNTAEKTHFPAHLKSFEDQFNILRGKENILGKALQFSNHSSIMQFDFVVQLPPVLPCSYNGHYIRYLYFAQLFAVISGHSCIKCVVPFYVLPMSSSLMLTPINLQERLSIFRQKAKQEQKTHGKKRIHLGSMVFNGLLPKSSFLPSSDNHFIENSILPSIHAFGKLEERDNISSFLNHEIPNVKNRSQTKFEISVNEHSIGVLFINDTQFCDGENVQGFLSLHTPCLVRVTLEHIERCGSNTPFLTKCCQQYQCCWHIPSFQLSLKIPNNAFKSFESDLVSSHWSLNFEFAISLLLFNPWLIQPKNEIIDDYAFEDEENDRKFKDLNIISKSPSLLGDEYEYGYAKKIKKQKKKQKKKRKKSLNTGYLNTESYDIWKLCDGGRNDLKNNMQETEISQKSIDVELYEKSKIHEVLSWRLNIRVMIKYKPLRCVTRSNAVIVKC